MPDELTYPETVFVSRLQAAAKRLQDMYGELSAINTLYYGATGYNGTITTAKLQSNPSLAHLTEGNLDAVATLINGLQANMTATLEGIAALAQTIP